MAMKTGLAKLEETETAWETHASNDTFYGTKLADYKAKVQVTRDADALIVSLKQQLTAAKNRKKDSLKENLALERNIANGISGDPKHGEDSDLWEATGRVRTSERKTGLTRKKKDGNENK
jgi:hypothetical protein